jgi:hypothetical protein
MGIEKPGADCTRIIAEHLSEFSHSFIDKDLTLVKRIRNAEAGVDVPIPLPTALTLIRHAAGGREGFYDLIPKAELDVLPCSFLNDSYEFIVTDNVILKQKRGVDSVFVYKVELLEGCLCEHFLCFKIARLVGAGKIHYIYDFHKRLPVVCVNTLLRL